jgi:hypothetical protein
MASRPIGIMIEGAIGRLGTTLHVAEDAAFPSPFLQGARGVQLADACCQTNRERRWVDLRPLKL